MATTFTLAPEELGPTITVGEILVEIMANTTGDGFLEAQPLSGPFPSGAPAIFIDQVARFGGSSAIISTVGDDDFGRLNLQRLSSDGVDVSAVSISKERPTGSAFVRYRENGSRDFVFNIAHSAAGETRLDDAANQLISKAGHLHIMGSAFTIEAIASDLIEAARRVKRRGGSVSLDPNLRKELLQDGTVAKYLHDTLSLTDLLLPSGEELSIISGEQDEMRAIEHLFSLGVKEVVLKRGAQGATQYAIDQAPVHVAAFHVIEIDPTGAGDCFGAVYLTARRLGLAVQDCLTYANAAGACAVTRLGPMEGVETRIELEHFIREQHRGAA